MGIEKIETKRYHVILQALYDCTIAAEVADKAIAKVRDAYKKAMVVFAENKALVDELERKHGNVISAMTFGIASTHSAIGIWMNRHKKSGIASLPADGDLHGDN